MADDVFTTALMKIAEGEGLAKDDVTAIVVSAYESSLLEQEDQLKDQWDEIWKKIKKNEKDIGEEESEFDESIAKHPDFKLLRKKIASIGLRISDKDENEWSDEGRTKDGKSNIYSIFVETGQDYRRRTKGATKVGDVWGHAKLSKKVQVPVPKKLLTLAEEGKKLAVQKGEIEEERMEVKRNLANLGRKERQAKAMLARIALEKSKEGRELLSRLGVGVGAPKLITVQAQKKKK